MISKMDERLSPSLKVLKTTIAFLVPLLGISAVLGAIFSLFKNAEGSHSHEIALSIFIGSVVLIVLLKWLNALLSKKNELYRFYTSAAVKNVQPSSMFPLLVLSLLVLIPFYLVFITSVKTPNESNWLEFTWWPKNGIHFDIYKEMFEYEYLIGISLIKAVWNSVLFALIPTAIGLITSSIAGYAFAKVNFQSKEKMYTMLVATMMMPGCVTIATSYIMFEAYGMTNSALPLIIPGIFGTAGMVMFIREFVTGIPDGLLEAAKLDGANAWQSYTKIVLPLAKPALIAQFVLNFISKFNDFLGPLIYLNDPSKYTIQVALNYLNSTLNDNASIAVSAVYAIAPMLLLYIIFRKKILNGIAMSSGIKG